jgi:DNA-binding NarL/FixJ family response regulator
VPRTSIHVGRSVVGRRTADTRTSVALIAEEGPRESIGAILREERLRFTVFDEVEDLLDQPVADGPSVILLWIEDTISSPAGLIEPLRRGIERAPVVVICAGIRRWEVRAALAAGAAGVVLEDEMAGALGPCLHAVGAGQICVPRQHWRQIEPPALSSREKQILGLVVMGYMNSQIAERLFLAESTIKSHLSSAFGKLGVRSRHEAVDLILDSERGLGMGILALGGEPLEPTATAAR